MTTSKPEKSFTAQNPKHALELWACLQPGESLYLKQTRIGTKTTEHIQRDQRIQLERLIA